MGSYFQDNPPTPEEIAKWRADLTRGWPYTEDDPEPDFFDWTPDPDRSATTDSIYLLKATGNWTAEDERIAFDPSKPPPRPLAYSQKNAEGWFKTLKKKYPLYKGEFGKIEDALAQRIAFAEELRRDGAKYGLVFSR